MGVVNTGPHYRVTDSKEHHFVVRNGEEYTHNTLGPARTLFYSESKKRYVEYKQVFQQPNGMYESLYCRVNGPARIKWYKCGRKKEEYYRVLQQPDGTHVSLQHRMEGPSCVCWGIDKTMWYAEYKQVFRYVSLYHRMDGPSRSVFLFALSVILPLDTLSSDLKKCVSAVQTHIDFQN